MTEFFSCNYLIPLIPQHKRYQVKHLPLHIESISGPKGIL
jgi:hypothetical protein